MACDRGHVHLVVFAHACGHYSRAATNWGVTSIQISTAIANGLLYSRYRPVQAKLAIYGLHKHTATIIIILL